MNNFNVSKLFVGLSLALLCLVGGCGDESAPSRLNRDRSVGGLQKQNFIPGADGLPIESNMKDEPKITPVTGTVDFSFRSGGQQGVVAHLPLFQCNSWPVTGTALFYWIHADVSIAAKNAMNVCWNRTYLPCNYRCFRIQ